MKNRIKYSTLSILLGSMISHAAFAEGTSLEEIPNFSQGYFYLGIGENSAQVSNEQTLSANQLITYNTSTASQSTTVTGNSPTYTNSTSAFSPVLQAGYMKAFTNPDYLWGAKLAYQHPGTTLTQNSITIARGSITNLANGAVTSTVTSSQASISDEVLLTPFLGYSLNNRSYLYFGAGPALFDVQTDEYNMLTSMSGIPTTSSGPNYSDSQWIWGAAAEIGVNYFFSSGWFLDFNCTYAVTQHYTTSFDVDSSFRNLSTNYTTNTGTLNVYQYNVIQTVGLSINKLF